jgi:hypothetical protein
MTSLLPTRPLLPATTHAMGPVLPAAPIPAAAPEVTRAAAPAITPGPTPVSYDYDVTLDPATRSLGGSGRVVVRNDQADPLTEVFLRVWTETPDLARRGASGSVTNVRVDGAAVAGASQDRTVVRVPLAKPLATGEQATVDFDVRVAVANSMDRTGVGRDGTLYFGNALPTLAVRDDEGWNLDPYVSGGESFYSLASDWKVRLHAPEAKQLITTGTLGAGTVTGGVRDTTATAQHARDFIVVAAEGYEQLTQQVGGTKVNVWAPKSDAAIGRSMLATATSSLDFFNQRYGAYDQPEMDVIASRGLGGGMEYPGVTINDSTSGSGFLREVVAHENAHQWFYSMVGNNEYDDPWLDESFATAITSEYLKTPVEQLVSHLRPTLEGHAGPREPGIVPPATGPAAAAHVSSPMTVLDHHGHVDMIYGTGARVLGSLKGEVGEDAWLRGMREWVGTRRNGVATTAGYIDTMSKAAGRDLTPWFEQHGVFAHEASADEHLDPNLGGM